VRDDLQEYILTHLADPEAVLVVDETAFSKKEEVGGVAANTRAQPARSPIVRSESSGLCKQIWTVLLDRELYLHADWEKDPSVARRRVYQGAAHHGSKTDVVQTDAGASLCPWSEGRLGDRDTVYWRDYKLRSWLEEACSLTCWRCRRTSASGSPTG